jgi:hypothetical protein
MPLPVQARVREPADYRLQGIAVALGELADAHGQRDLAKMVLQSLRVSVIELGAAGADRHGLMRLTGDATG